ncbi:MAG: methyltransferase domain-containing protein, partial [Clostridia bacterium]|nr:methyltransferase domain-containing protein [Clostridia bacterium]
ALEREETLFVVPSLLLALGSVGGERARRALADYAPPEARERSEEKHAADIREALGKARARLSEEALPVYAPAGPRRFLACAPEGFAGTLLEELRGLGLEAEPAGAGCAVETADWRALYRSRCMTELLLPLGAGLPLEPEAIASVAAPELSLPYRIELAGYAGDRGAFLRRLKNACGGENNPARYALELRVLCRGESCELYLKPSCDESGRYPWRRRALSASMKPALAACLARHVAPLVDHPRVLDPFAGSGTLLFSMEEAFPCRSLLGVDIAKSAVEAARENAAAGKSRARFVQQDILRFAPRERVELVVANLPFGNRVGTHESNRRLYAGFLDRLPLLITDGGLALLYTMEYRLLTELIKKRPALRLTDARRTEAGGLLPWLCLLRLDGRAARP